MLMSRRDHANSGNQHHATGLLHDAGASDAPELDRDAAGGPRGHHPRRQARLPRRLHGRAPHRPLRERHQQHAVPRHADRRDQADQARDRHHQSLAHAPGADRAARRDVRPPVAGPLHPRRQRRRADVGRRGARHPRPGPQQDVRRGDRRDPGDLGARAALRHRLSRTTASRSRPRARRRCRSASAIWASPTSSRVRRSSARWSRRSRRAWC